MPPELQEVRLWITKAGRDQRTAEIALDQEPPITDIAAFHVQQAIEKYLKAFLVHQEIEFEKVHDLEKLVETCAAVDADCLSLKPAVAPLTAYAVRFRYPGPADPTVEEIHDALAVVDAVRRFVADRLPPEVLV